MRGAPPRHIAGICRGLARCALTMRLHTLKPQPSLALARAHQHTSTCTGVHSLAARCSPPKHIHSIQHRRTLARSALVLTLASEIVRLALYTSQEVSGYEYISFGRRRSQTTYGCTFNDALSPTSDSTLGCKTDSVVRREVSEAHLEQRNYDTCDICAYHCVVLQHFDGLQWHHNATGNRLRHRISLRCSSSVFQRSHLPRGTIWACVF